ncbi:hypothetical protein ACIQNU_00695 [Streptomyces sp. NPDC091292]|uniref:hypothetical protein n=1 Tax=Streptomyces sp. NPDC091292 TaxID=3365991 RepID=UPI003824310C
MAQVPGAVVAVGGLVGGFGVARWSGRREIGGLVLGLAGVGAVRQWRRDAGGGVAGALSVAYLAGFAGSHPLAKKIGAWPAVFTVAGGVAAASWALADRHR